MFRLRVDAHGHGNDDHRCMINVNALTKRYGDHTAVDAVTFTVQPGTVAGFLGPNGAGKSTTMRMIVGLTHATSGTATVLGRDYRSLGCPGRHVGVLLDAAAQHQGRTGREVLTLGAITLGLPRARADEMLERVGLNGNEATRRIGNYSLGMRQRLGIAHALLGDPQVLILDEPANGLDPAGIRWMRGLLRDFADGGGTVLLSSHLLSEVEAVADELIVIGGGRIVAHGTAESLLEAGSTLIRTVDDARMADAAGARGMEVTATPDGLAISGDAERVSQLAFDEGLRVRELRPAGRHGLEDLFLALTADTARDGAHLEVTR